MTPRHTHTPMQQTCCRDGEANASAVVHVPRCRVTKPEPPEQQVPARRMARVSWSGHEHAQRWEEQL